jgi:hypothetical protein
MYHVTETCSPVWRPALGRRVPRALVLLQHEAPGPSPIHLLLVLQVGFSSH